MHKNYISVVVSVLMLAGSVVPAYAKGSEVSVDASASVRFRIMHALDQVRSTIRTRVQEKQQEIKDDNKEKRQEVKDKPSVSQADRIKKWATGSQRRLTSLISRMSTVADRIQVKIDVLAKAGADVTVPRAALVDAKAKITLASTALTSASAQVDGIIANNTPKDAVTKLRALEKGVIAKIRDAHRALMNAWTQTHKVSVSVSASVTPTP